VHNICICLLGYGAAPLTISSYFCMNIQMAAIFRWVFPLSILLSAKKEFVAYCESFVCDSVKALFPRRDIGRLQKDKSTAQLDSIDPDDVTVILSSFLSLCFVIVH